MLINMLSSPDRMVCPGGEALGCSTQFAQAVPFCLLSVLICPLCLSPAPPFCIPTWFSFTRGQSTRVDFPHWGSCSPPLPSPQPSREGVKGGMEGNCRQGQAAPDPWQLPFFLAGAGNRRHSEGGGRGNGWVEKIGVHPPLAAASFTKEGAAPQRQEEVEEKQW